MKYEDIIFLQDSEAEAFFDILDLGEDKAFDYLLQWDYGESPVESSVLPPWGHSDTVYKRDDYRMSYNTRLGYAGLIRIISGDIEGFHCPVCGGNIRYQHGTARCTSGDWMAEDFELKELLEGLED